MITLNRTSSENTDFQNLVVLLDKDLAIRDGNEHEFYARLNKITKLNTVIICYDGTIAIGCGAFREVEPGKVEIKRMFVLPEYRGKGVAMQILKQLELWAAELNYSKCILETGKKQPEAIALYKKAGYAIIKNYGAYENVANSVCMIKIIS